MLQYNTNKYKWLMIFLFVCLFVFPFSFHAFLEIKTFAQSASTGGDFSEIASTTVLFEPGQDRQTVDILILNDVDVEGVESLTVELSNPDEGVLREGFTQATITIIDDDSKMQDKW